MRLQDKSAAIADAIARIGDGAVVMLGGFGVPGTPFALIAELVRSGARGLTVIKNDANETGMGVDHLLAAGQVARLITTHIGLNPRAIALMNAGQLAVEFCGQGILAERIRAGGAGLGAVLTDVGLDTELGGRQAAHRRRRRRLSGRDRRCAPTSPCCTRRPATASAISPMPPRRGTSTR